MNESVIAPVTPDEFENGLFFMPSDSTLIMLHLNQWDSNHGYINKNKGNEGWEEFFTDDVESQQLKLASGFSIVNMRIPKHNSKETDFRTLVIGLKKPYK